MCLKQLQLSRYPTNPESITTRHRRETLRLTFPCMIWRGLGEARGGCPSTWQPSHSTGVPCSQEIVRPYGITLGPQAQSYRLCGNLAEGFLGTLASNQFLEERNAWYYASHHRQVGGLDGRVPDGPHRVSATWQPLHSAGVPRFQEIARPHGTTIGPQAQSYCRVLGSGSFL